MKVSLTDILSHVRLEHAQVPSTTTFLHVADLPRRILTLNLTFKMFHWNYLFLCLILNYSTQNDEK